MTAIDDIIANLPMSQLAGQVGSDEQSTEAAVRQAIPALLGGLHANTQDPAGAASLEGALQQHSSQLVDGGVDLNQVDAGEGQKIVSNIFGGQQDQVVQTLGSNLGGVGGDQSSLVTKLLPLLAPIVMSYLAKQMGGGAAGGGGGLGSILGSVLGGGNGGVSGAGAGSNPMGDILGSMLGGGAQNPNPGQQNQPGGSVLDMLGGMLGGGRR